MTLLLTLRIIIPITIFLMLLSGWLCLTERAEGRTADRLMAWVFLPNTILLAICFVCGWFIQ